MIYYSVTIIHRFGYRTSTKRHYLKLTRFNICVDENLRPRFSREIPPKPGETTALSVSPSKHDALESCVFKQFSTENVIFMAVGSVSARQS